MNNEEILSDFKKEMQAHLKRISLLSDQLTDDPVVQKGSYSYLQRTQSHKKRILASINAIKKVVDDLKSSDFDDYLPNESIDITPENPDNIGIIEYLESGVEPDLNIDDDPNLENIDMDDSF